MNLIKPLAIAALILLSILAFYYALFWGWASGTGTVDQPHLKTASNVALAVSFLAFWSAVFFAFPVLSEKKEEERRR